MTEFGSMIGDDFTPHAWPGVVRAVLEFAQEMKIELFHGDNVWVLRKTPG